jgi:hypothetical protein
MLNPRGDTLPNSPDYTPATWEKIVSVSVAVAIVALVSYLVVRNEPFAEPQLAALVRILLSLAIAVLGGTIPGFLKVDLSTKGIAIRAAGALALFVITYFFSPALAPSLDSDRIPPLKHPRPVTELHPAIAPRLERVQLEKGSGPPKNPLELRSAVQGDSPKNRKLYDLSVSSSSADQVMLNNFHVRWFYKKGVLSAIGQGIVLKPQEKYSVMIPVDTDKAGRVFEENVPMSPPILLPPKNGDGPSVATIRLEVLYQLTGRLNYHPNDDWDLYYQVILEDDHGDNLQLLSRSWRRDKNVDWVKQVGGN